MYSIEDIRSTLLRCAQTVRQGWCRGAPAVDKNGSSVGSSSSEAVRWCAIGAMCKETGSDVAKFADLYGLVAADLIESRNMSLSEWNDNVASSGEDVARLFEKVSERLLAS